METIGAVSAILSLVEVTGKLAAFIKQVGKAPQEIRKLQGDLEHYNSLACQIKATENAVLSVLQYFDQDGRKLAAHCGNLRLEHLTGLQKLAEEFLQVIEAMRMLITSLIDPKGIFTTFSVEPNKCLRFTKKMNLFWQTGLRSKTMDLQKQATELRSKISDQIATINAILSTDSIVVGAETSSRVQESVERLRQEIEGAKHLTRPPSYREPSTSSPENVRLPTVPNHTPLIKSDMSAKTPIAVDWQRTPAKGYGTPITWTNGSSMVPASPRPPSRTPLPLHAPMYQANISSKSDPSLSWPLQGMERNASFAMPAVSQRNVDDRGTISPNIDLCVTDKSVHQVIFNPDDLDFNSSTRVEDVPGLIGGLLATREISPPDSASEGDIEDEESVMEESDQKEPDEVADRSLFIQDAGKELERDALGRREAPDLVQSDRRTGQGLGENVLDRSKVTGQAFSDHVPEFFPDSQTSLLTGYWVIEPDDDWWADSDGHWLRECGDYWLGEQDEFLEGPEKSSLVRSEGGNDMPLLTVRMPPSMVKALPPVVQAPPFVIRTPVPRVAKFDRRHVWTFSLQLQTLSFLRPLMGASVLSLGWRADPEIFEHKVYPDQAQSPFHVQFRYFLPSLIFGDATLDLFRWNRMNSASLCPRLTHSREVDDMDLAIAIRKGDVGWIRQQIQNRTLLPGDSVKGVGAPLEYSLNLLDYEEGYAMTELFLQKGFRCLDTPACTMGAGRLAMFKLIASRSELPPRVEALLQRVVDLDGVVALGCATALHDALLERSRFSVRQVLAKAHADLEARDKLGFSALHWACVRGCPSDVQALLKHGAAVNAATVVESWTPLHLACMFRELDITAHLINSGADVHLEDFGGRTPIHFVADHNEICERLIAAGADRLHRDFDGNNPLHSIAKVPTLGGSPPKRLDQVVWAIFFKDELLWNQMNNQGESPMQIAAMYNPGFTWCFDNLRAPMSEPSLSRGRNIFHFIALYWNETDTSTYYATYMEQARRGYIERARQGLEFIDDPDALDDMGMTPMELLELRMFMPDTERLPGVQKPTGGDVYSLVALLDEVRRMRWFWIDNLISDCRHLPPVEQVKPPQEVNKARKITLWRMRVTHGHEATSDRVHWLGEKATSDYSHWESETWRLEYPWWRDIDDNDSGLDRYDILHCEFA